MSFHLWVQNYKIKSNNQKKNIVFYMYWVKILLDIVTIIV